MLEGRDPKSLATENRSQMIIFHKLFSVSCRRVQKIFVSENFYKALRHRRTIEKAFSSFIFFWLAAANFALDLMAPDEEMFFFFFSCYVFVNTLM